VPARPAEPPRRPRPSSWPRRAQLAGAIGARGELLACEHLLRRGFRILARNVRTRGGEIDLIAVKGATLVFAEVKTVRVASRSSVAAATAAPLARLGAPQRSRLRRLATAWLLDCRTRRPRGIETIRFDAIGVVVALDGSLLRLEHLEGAW
jgi:putative endonuclease